MRRLALVGTILLAGCGQTMPQIDTTALSVVVKQVQEFTVKLCSFLPTDETIVSIITATQAGESSYAIAAAVCKAVTASPTVGALGANTAPCPVVAGVCVEGQFIDPKDFEKIQEDPIPDDPVPPAESQVGVPVPTPTEPAPEGAPQP